MTKQSERAPLTADASEGESRGVLDRVGYVDLCCFCVVKIKASVCIWLLNLVCFIAHSLMIYATLHFAYFRHGRNWRTDDAEHLMIPIYRIRAVPTQNMLESNTSKWSSSWNNNGTRRMTSTEPNSGLFLYDNGMPINFATLIVAFFATSAIFHLWALVFGTFKRFRAYYWYQMDNCYCYWRWLEYGISAAVMSMALGITIGIREQFALSGLFMLTWCCMAFGFMVEYHSVPKGDTDTINYAMRMVPHILGWFPMTSVWFWLIAQLETTKRDVAEVTDREIPTWVNALIYGTFLIFMCFAVVQIVFQALAAKFYWGTEICYCILSLTAKLYLGWFLLINVLYVDGSTADETLQGGGAGVSAPPPP